MPWFEVRKYLNTYRDENIPSHVDGSYIKAKRCIYFMSVCSVNGETICLGLNEKQQEVNMTLSGIDLSGKRIIYGYIVIKYIEDLDCICSTNIKRKFQATEDLFIYYSKFYKLNN